ncbi:MAG: hypothetical protein Q8M08_02670 [Bacteroidales bacterium]|nr:hypothetical protein [Bacteroidales bacterium]
MERESLLHKNPQFEPGVNTKKLWLYCRRVETQIGSPGFLCSPKQWDLALFFLIILLEIIGLYLFYKYVGNLTFAIAFLLADVTFAIFAHIVHGSMSLTQNRLFLLRRNVKLYLNKPGRGILALARDGQINREKWKLFRYKVFSSTFYSSISLLAFFKIVGFIANWPGRDPINSISITICLTYIIVAVLQIYATGYFTFSSLFFVLFDWNLKQHKEQKGRHYARIDAGTSTNNLYEGIDIHTLLLTERKFYELGYQQKTRESLPKFNNCTVRNHFIHDNKLYLYGILTDEDLNAFVNCHANNVEAKQVLGIVLLDLQLEKCILNGGKDVYTEPIPFPAGNIAGLGAIEPGRQKVAEYSVAKVANDLDENRKERAGRCWEYEWILEEHTPDDNRQHPPATIKIPNAITRSKDQLSVTVNFEGMKAGQTCYLSVYAKNLAEPFVRGISSPAFPIRIIA